MSAAAPGIERRGPRARTPVRTQFPIWFAATEGARAALGSIRAHSFRSLLTTLGIVIGVGSVIAMISIIQGLSVMIGDQFAGLGANGVTVSSFTSREAFLAGRIARLSEADYNLIRFRVEGLESITPIMQTNGQVRSGSKATATQVIGSTYAYQGVAQYYTSRGRFVSDSDNQTRRRVAVIGEQVRADLALPENPLGEYIQFNGEWLRIIGLLEEKGEIFGQSQDNQLIIPFNTLASLQGNQRQRDLWIRLTIRDLSELDQVSATITRLLRTAHNIGREDEDDFRVQSAQQLQDTVEGILNTVTVVMSGIVSISLLVGGIGIMNIMLVSVTERTREIGICKAIGAKRHHILLQFLLEALVLCLFGGLIGLVLGYGIGALAASFIPGFPPAYTPWWAVALALGFSGVVGVVFGILPAAKAANLDPISSLRYE
ncbi:MAG TPA: ABC transporter permease [Gammaproteobacteria bacterium]|nr:ABC transporter permease [Gammaproteobacteria bacterium]